MENGDQKLVYVILHSPPTLQQFFATAEPA